LAEIDATIEEPGFWDDPGTSAPLLQKRARLERQLQNLGRLDRERDDLEGWRELIDEGGEEDAAAFASRLAAGLETLEMELKLSGPDDGRDALLAINAGAGGTEAQDWAQMLERMYLRYGEQHGYQVQMLDRQEGEEAGIKSATLAVRGDNAYGFLKSESGVHRLVRISPYDANSRRHTSFASVFVYPEVDDSVEIEINDKDLRVDTYRSSGAGGQHVNRTDSAVRLTHLPTGVVVTCQNERSQIKNRSMAMKVLRSRLYDLEIKKRDAEKAKLEDQKKEIGFGSQIRSYVLHPYRMVKDHRTKTEVGDADRVLDGGIDPFVEAFLRTSIDGGL